MNVKNLERVDGSTSLWKATVNGEVFQFYRHDVNGSFRWYKVENGMKTEAGRSISFLLECERDEVVEKEYKDARIKYLSEKKAMYHFKKGMLTAALVALLFIIESICMVQYENSPDGNQDYFGITRSNLVKNSAPKVGVENNHSYKYKENYVNHD